MKYLIILFTFIISLTSFAVTRTVFVGVDQVADVRTALGIATKVLLQENPNSAPIIGDLGAFRIESIENGYAIKPLRYGAKTNFFISTKDRSFIVRLSTVTQDQADYVVYLVPPHSVIGGDKNKAIVYKDYKRIKKENELTLILKKIGKTSDGFIIFEFSLNSATDQIAGFERFKIKQGKSYKTIHNLILTDRRMEANRPLLGYMTIRLKDLDSYLPLTIEMQTKEQNKFLILDIPKEALWIK